MEQYTKNSLNILRRLDSVITQSVHRVRDLSTIWVGNSLCHVLCSRLGLCACVCCDLKSCVCCFSSLTLVPFLWSNIVRARGSNLWRLLANGKRLLKKITVVLKVDHWITWEGLGAILDRRRSPPRGSRHWSNHGINHCVLCLSSLWLVFF